MRDYRFQLVLRAVLLAGSGALCVYLFAATRLVYAPLAVALLTIAQVVLLVRYAERVLRDVTRFLEAIRHGDVSQNVLAASRGPLFDRLDRAFAEVMETFRTVRAQREEHAQFLQTVVQHVGLALIAFRADGTVELMNAAAKRLLGTSQVHDIKDLLPLSRPLVDTLLRLDSGERAVVDITREEQDMQLAVYATRFRLRGSLHALVSLQDIRSELEEREMEAWQKLTRVLTHEIMNSAGPISSLAHTAHGLLQRDGDEQHGAPAPEDLADTREALDAIMRRTEALMHFVDSYRSFTKIIKPSFGIVRVELLLRQVSRLLRVQAQEQGIEVRLHVEPEHLEITADEELLEQVLINLMLNAMDALADEPEPHLLLEGRLDRLGHALIQVRDNGPGIPPDLQSQIFVPFFTTKEEGSGIGLTLSRQIMRLHGGTLTLQSEPGRGTTFTLRF